MISAHDYLYFVDDALDGMVGIVTDLGDELANQRLDLPGANSPYAVLTHCLGVIDYWAGYIVAGRAIERDRAAEFRASGAVADLIERVRQVRAQLESDISELDPGGAPRGTPEPGDVGLPIARTQGGALVHVYEELAQHRGQMETMRDVIRADWSHVA